MSDQAADRDPLVALREGDVAPFEAFVRAGTGSLLAFFRRLGADAQVAEDLTQETFLKMFHAAPRYEPRERVEAYAFRVARNAWVDHRRRRAARPHETRGPSLDGAPGRDERGAVPQPEAPGPDALAGLLRRESAARLRAAVGALPETHRLVVDLALMQELPYAEIATVLEIPVGTVKSRMFHAVRKLREALEEPPDEGGERP